MTIHSTDEQWTKIRAFLHNDAHAYDGVDEHLGQYDCPCPSSAASGKKGPAYKQVLGRSRGSFGTKIYIVVDGLANPLRVLLTSGQCRDRPDVALWMP